MIRRWSHQDALGIEVEIDSLRSREPEGADRRPRWITPAEWAEAEPILDRGRRWEWLGGRLAAKQALQGTLSGPAAWPFPGLESFCIRSRDPAGRPTLPRSWNQGSPVPASLSISHSARLAVAVVTDGASVGVDLVDGSVPGIDGASWAAVEAAFKTGICPVPFSPDRWQCTRRGEGFEIESPGGDTVWCRVWRRSSHWLALCMPGTRRTDPQGRTP